MDFQNLAATLNAANLSIQKPAVQIAARIGWEYADLRIDGKGHNDLIQTLGEALQGRQSNAFKVEVNARMEAIVIEINHPNAVELIQTIKQSIAKDFDTQGCKYVIQPDSMLR